MNNRPLILVGGGGHCKSVIEAAESTGCCIKGILDLTKYVGSNILGYPVIGTDDDIVNYVKDCNFVVTVGFVKDCSLREVIHNRIIAEDGQLASILASTAHVSYHSQIGAGTVVLHQATVNAGVNIGAGCIINTSSNIEHDCIIGCQSHISTGAMINGGCTIGKKTFIGSGAVLKQGISITDSTIIGAGSVVTKDITTAGIYFGNPAQLIKPF